MIHSTKYQRMASAGALLLAGCILLISLSAPATIFFHNTSFSLTEQKPLAKIAANEVVPGHPLYTFMMIRDRVRIQLTKDKQERVALFIGLSQHRFVSAQLLLANNEPEFALATLTKSSLYLMRAYEESLALTDSQKATELPRLKSAITDHIVLTNKFMQNLTDQQKSLAEESLKQLKVALKTLSTD